MVEISQAGFECPIIIKRNADCVTYSLTRDTDNNVVVDNGIIIISAAYVAPYTSFAALIAAYNDLEGIVVLADTDEVRIYDGTENVDETVFIDPLFDSTALVTHHDTDISRPVKVIHEVGNAQPADLKQTVCTYKVNIDKLYSGRWKTAYAGDPEQPTAVTPTDTVPNPIGQTLLEGILSPNSGSRGEQGYTNDYLVIIYSRDNSDATAGIRAQTIIFPCAKVESANIKTDADGIVAENVKISGLRYLHFPLDVYQNYDLDLGDQQ